jgi:hypothetical protein
MNDWKDKLKAAMDKVADTEIRPGDESKLAENPMNAAIGAMGLPENWKQSVADYKQATKDLPMNMAMGTMGTVAATDGLAGQALSKLQAAKQAGQALSTAEEYLLSKATGKGVTVVPTAQELAQNAFSKVKGMMGK